MIGGIVMYANQLGVNLQFLIGMMLCGLAGGVAGSLAFPDGAIAVILAQLGVAILMWRL